MDKRRKREQKLADRVARNAAKQEAAQNPDGESPPSDGDEPLSPDSEREPDGPAPT